MASLVFFGTPEIAAQTLTGVLRAGHDVLMVVTNPDRPSGRGKKLVSPPVKLVAEQNDIPVIQPQRVYDNEELRERLRQSKVDFFVVIAYGRILPQDILDIPSECSLNVHYSLLPRHRGAAPIHYCLMHGDEETGVSVIEMNEKMDEGDIVLSKPQTVHPGDTRETLTERLLELGIECLLEVLRDYHHYDKVRQDHNKATYTGKVFKDIGQIRWARNAEDIFNLFRAMKPNPGIFCLYNGKKLAIEEMSLCDKTANFAKNPRPGQVLKADKSGLTVATGDIAVCLLKVKPENRKSISATDFINGYGILAGDRFD